MRNGTAVDVAVDAVRGNCAEENMFLLDDGLLLLDYEVAHCGNPGYDVATFVNHMLLKGFCLPELRERFALMAQTMWEAYRRGFPAKQAGLVEQEALLLGWGADTGPR